LAILQGVSLAINFDRQSRARTEKVEDIRPDRMLTAESQAVELSSPDRGPQH
jgi:hypothetical protein